MNAIKALAALTLFLLTPLAAAQDESAQTAIHCGSLLVIPGEDPIAEATIVIENGRVTQVVQGYIEPADATLIDLKDKFVLPGLIDCHTHLTFEMGPMSERLRSTLTEDNSHAAIDGAIFAQKTLMAGFTTVRNVGSAGAPMYALRDRIAAGALPGPRILAAGKSIAVTGGHADSTNGISPALRPRVTPIEGIADGPYEMRKAVRERVKRGSDLIKITATGGVLSNTAAGTGQQMFEDEIRAVVETAATMGRKVAAHAHGADGIKAAIRGGVHSIEHGTYLDDEAIQLFIDNNCYLVPTIHAGKFVAEKSEDETYFNPAIREKAAAVGPVIQGAFGRAYAAGVPIAFGTDVGVGEHGTNWLEFVYMTEAGMPNDAAIVSATINAADLLGMADDLGTLEPGKLADLIALDNNPLEDINAFETVPFVMKEGVVYKDE